MERVHVILCTWTEVAESGTRVVECGRRAEAFVVDPLGQLLPTCAQHAGFAQERPARRGATLPGVELPAAPA